MTYDLIIVGGGLAGSSLARNMVESGSTVLVLEREKAFRDRIRGEAMHPWGVVEARKLGIYEPLLDTCGHVCNRWKTYFSGEVMSDRDLLTTSPHKTGEFHFYHPDMQEVLLHLAAEAGAEIRRGARLSDLDSVHRRVAWTENGETFEADGGLVVGADGSRSMVRKLAGFEVQEDEDRLMLAGVMMENAGVPDDCVHQFQGTDCFAILFPQGSRRTRSYIGYPLQAGKKHLAGDAHKPAYLDLCRKLGIPADWLENCELTGPLAEFHGADRWVAHPAREGIVLIGDAAAKPDPCWGTGLSLSLRDVRTLRDELQSTTDWETAIHRYADEHDVYYQALRAVEDWFTHLFWDQGEAADTRRMDVFPKLEGPGAPDIVGLGPESPTEIRAG
jgi:2-polyprenyl-6-methoxyphenol hydroxylase-like FAD-dependent oxidoreductase